MELNELRLTAKKEKQLERRGFESVEDILWYFPRKYNDFRFETGLRPKEEKSCFRAVVTDVFSSNKSVSYICATVKHVDTQEKIVVTWFNQAFKYREIYGMLGKGVFICGNAEYNSYKKCQGISNPDIFTTLPDANKIYPVYRKIAEMSDEYFAGVMDAVFASLTGYIEDDPLPDEEIERNDLIRRKEAFDKIHHPETMEDIEIAKRRFNFEDLLYFAARIEEQNRSISVGSPYQIKSLSMVNEVKYSLPYLLTADQKKVLEEMIARVRDGKRLNTLVQGDVGSGKSIVAFLMMIAFASSGYQAVIMAPTQILAKQHYSDLTELIGNKLNIVYLGAELKAAEKKKVKAQIERGEADIIVGTHAVIADDTVYKDLALCVIDEEHRFGVEQRKKLTEKAGKGVHAIKLSATPIPRSLTETIFRENTQVCNIKTKPAGRIPVKTGIARDRNAIYNFIYSQVKKHGHQIYVVCPMIDKNEDMDGVKSVEEISEEYTSALAPWGVRIGTVTGRDSKTQSEATLTAFKAGELDVLISTTVIEVGVNVPNATGIAICSADRFGLAQLHQLRGRVGRSTFESYCVFEVDDLADKPKAKDRLATMCKTTDGFEIAEADLIQRGSGDLLGTAQSGDDYYMDLVGMYPELYEQAKGTAARLLDNAASMNWTKLRSKR